MFIYVDAPLEEVRPMISRWESEMGLYAPFGPRATHFLAVVDSPTTEVDAGYGQVFERYAPGVFSLSVAWVEPDYRGLGVWKALVTKRLEWCAAKGGHLVLVEADSQQRRKISALESLGGVFSPLDGCVEFHL